VRFCRASFGDRSAPGAARAGGRGRGDEAGRARYVRGRERAVGDGYGAGSGRFAPLGDLTRTIRVAIRDADGTGSGAERTPRYAQAAGPSVRARLSTRLAAPLALFNRDALNMDSRVLG